MHKRSDVDTSLLFVYVSKLLQPENVSKDPINSSVQRQFLGLIEHLQTQGVQDLIAWVDPVVEDVFQQAKLVWDGLP